MIVIQKYFKDNNITNSYPVPDSSGFIAYSFKKNKIKEYNFVYYKWENTKSHPSYYCFKYFNRDPDNIWINQTEYANWSVFFVEVNKIKTELLKKNDVNIAKTVEEAYQMLWKSFIKSQDHILASFATSLPESFLNSIDDSLDVEAQINARYKCLNYMKEKMFVVFYNWQNYIDVNVELNFCSWFYNYYYGIV